MLERGLETVFDIPSRLGQSLAEVLIAFRFDPRVMLRPVLQPFFVDLRREQLGERRADGFLPRRLAREVDIRVHCETHAGQNMFQRLHVLALQTASVAEPQPRFDAAFVCLRAVVVDDAEDPLPALISVRHVRKDRCVLEGDADLVVKTVVYPALNLRFGALAAVHCYMERMVDVIAGSLRAQLLLKLFFSPGRLYWWSHGCYLTVSADKSNGALRRGETQILLSFFETMLLSLSDRDVHPIIGHFDA